MDNLNQALPTLRAHGLPVDYDDVLTPDIAVGDDSVAMSQGHHFNYQTQQWVDGHDHAHCKGDGSPTPLLFCGADAQTCFGIDN